MAESQRQQDDASAAVNAERRLNESAIQLLRLASLTSTATTNGKAIPDVWSALNAQIRRRALRRAGVVLVALAVALVAVAYVPTLNWTAAAVGRLVLIRGVLPWWDWRHLDGDLCVWPKIMGAEEVADRNDAGTWEEEANDAGRETCVYCEQIDRILQLRAPISAVDFERYVRFNQPILVLPPGPNISTSTEPSWTPTSIHEHLLRADEALGAASEPCDVHSNVLFGAAPTLNQIVEHTLEVSLQAAASDDAAVGPWHVAYRNCAPGATKASRPLWPRPAWIPLHLRPYRFSWMLMSSATTDRAEHDATAPAPKRLPARGLAAMTQLCGERFVQLLPLAAQCRANEECRQLRWKLRTAETLVFDAERWRLEYEVGDSVIDDEADSDVDWLSASFVAEFEWLY